MQNKNRVRNRKYISLAFYVSVAFAAACSGATEDTSARSFPSGSQPEPSNGLVSTLAGSGQAKSVNGIGRNASFDHPTDVTIDFSTGTIYVLEANTASIRSLTPKGVVETLIQGLEDPTAAAFDNRDEHLYVASAATSNVMRVGLDGSVSKFVHVTENGHLPPDILGKVAVDSSGALQITENRSGKILRITPAKAMSYNIVGPGVFGICYESKNFYAVNQVDGRIGKVVKNGLANFATSPLLQFSSNITYDMEGHAFYVTDPHRNRILKVTSGDVTVLAGDGQAGEVDGQFTNAEFDEPTGIVYDHETRALYVADSAGNTIRKITGM